MFAKRILTLLALVGVVTCQEGQIGINTNSRFMVDKYGRSTLFHGVNVVYKVDPYIPDVINFDSQLSMTDKDIDDLVKWGMNLVRLGVMWEAVERAPGVYDMEYLKRVDDLINRLGQKGIYTMVDAHQDVLARTFCGEGAPVFYFPQDKLDNKCPGTILPWVLEIFGQCKSMKDYGYRLDENGWPLIEDCTQRFFAQYYTSPEVISAFERLYDNIDGVQDAFIAYWDVVAKYFSGNQYVIGYDPINEPFPSNFVKDPSIVLIPGKFDRVKLQPLYKRVFETYQKYDKTKIMYYEAAEFPDEVGVGPGFVFNLGFTENPGGNDKTHLQVLNDHTYCCQLSADMCKTGEPPLEKTQQCKDWHEKRIKTRAQDAERYKVPLIISEFGACTGSESCIREIRSVVEMCDKYLVGWAYWEFKKFMDITTSAGHTSEGFYENDGTLQHKKVQALARTYLMATQGVPLRMDFDQDTGVFNATIKADATIRQPSIVYKSDEYYYPNGYTVTISNKEGKILSNDQVSVKQGKVQQHLEIFVENSQLHGNEINIVIQPKSSQIFIQ